VTNSGTTFVLFNHEIQWERNADGSYAHVGYNSRGNDIFNLPLSGTPFIGCTVNGDCDDMGRKKRATATDALNGVCLPANPFQLNIVNLCLDMARNDVDFADTFFNTAAQLSASLDPCPCTRTQADADTGRFVLVPGSANCFHETNPLIVEVVTPIQTVRATQQCCYNGE